jgi:hypothetical protein
MYNSNIIYLLVDLDTQLVEKFQVNASSPDSIDLQVNKQINDYMLRHPGCNNLDVRIMKGEQS